MGFESPFQRYRNSLLAGSTPPQLIFGELPCMLQESLSEDSGSPGLQAWTRWERFANEFRRENLRKHRAKQLALARGLFPHLKWVGPGRVAQ